MKLPEQLKQFEEELIATQKPFISIDVTPSETDMLQSKFSGNPYWLKAEPYPTDGTGKPLRLLAQINFSEITESLAEYPEKGILQFFIGTDDVFGMDFEDGTNQTNFRVVFHEEVEEDESKWLTDFPTFSEDEYTPAEQELALEFSLANEIVAINDFRFNEITNMYEMEMDDDDEEDVMDAYYEIASGQGHKIGGYPFFTQEDPRAYGDYPEHLILLFQMDTDDEANIMWGDSGVGNFFISAEDLRKHNFSRVLYNWDCY